MTEGKVVRGKKMSLSKRTEATKKPETENSGDDRTRPNQPSDAETQSEGAEVQSATKITVSDSVSPSTSSKTSDRKKAQPKATKVSIRQTSKGAILIASTKRGEIIFLLQTSTSKQSIASFRKTQEGEWLLSTRHNIPTRF